MQDNTKIHPLALAGKMSGLIRFIHFKDGEEHYFYSCCNRLTEDRMSAFDSEPPSINDSLEWVRSVFRDIREKSLEVLEVIGDF